MMKNILNCPNCGAPITPSKSFRCEYCNTEFDFPPGSIGYEREQLEQKIINLKINISKEMQMNMMRSVLDEGCSKLSKLWGSYTE